MTAKEHYEVRFSYKASQPPCSEWNALNRKSYEKMLLLLKKKKKQHRSRLIPCIEDDKERSVFITNICLCGKMLILPYL